MEQSGVLLEEEIREKEIIKVEDSTHQCDECYAPASYDLRLGDQYYIPGETNADHEVQPIKRCSNSRGILAIPPFSSVLVSTYENVYLPNNVVGRFDLRVMWALSGFHFQMGTQVEPGYHGKLFGLLHNNSDERRQIKYREDRLFTIEFQYTTGMADVPEEKRKERVDMREFIPDRKMISGRLDAFVSEAKRRINELEEEARQNVIELENQARQDVDRLIEITKFEADNMFSSLERVRKDSEDHIEKMNRNIELFRTDIREAEEKVEKKIEKEKSEIENMKQELSEANRQWTAIAFLIATALVGVILPIVISKLTYDVDDIPITNLSALNEVIADSLVVRKSQLDQTESDSSTLQSMRKILILKQRRDSMEGAGSSSELREITAEIEQLTRSLER